MTETLTDPRVVRAIELIWREAALLDAKDYEAWQRLYAEDALYVVPIERDAEDFGDGSISIKASQIIVAYKRGRHDLWAADVDYVVRLGAEDRLARKVVRLVNADDAVPAAGFLL